MILDMMLLNERAMQAMLDDANELDYEFPDDNTEEEEKSQKLIKNSSKTDSNAKKDNIIHGRDFSLAVPPPRNLDLRTSNTISPHLRKLARQLNSDVTV